jgi:hypothetical protein
MGIERTFPRPIPADLLDLLDKIFVYSQAERITAHDCLQHQFFKSVIAGSETLRDGSPFVLDQIG